MSRFQAHNVSVLGSGKEVLVFAHGFGTDQSVWRHIVPHLVDDYCLVLFDFIGTGTTNPQFYDFAKYSTFQGYAQDLISLLDELQIKSCIYVAHCVGCMIGCLASVLRPDFFSKLILIGPSPRYLNDVDYFGGIEQKELEQLYEAMNSNYKAWVSGFAPMALGGDNVDSYMLQEFSRTLFNMRPDIALHVAKTFFESDMRPILPQVTVPCHIFQSERDFVCPLAVADYLADHLGGKTVIQLLPTHGHLPQLTKPDVVLPLLRKHLALTL